MRILHILDHSIPHHSGYSFRTLSILREQRQLGWETYHLTGCKQGEVHGTEESVDGWHFYRTPVGSSLVAGIAGLGEIEMMGELAHRIEGLARRLRPHILHAHSPVLNAIPALRVGRRLNIPVVYEVRAFWEDAAVDHGTTSEGSLRYRTTRALETYALKRADGVVTICEGLRKDILSRGIVPSKVAVVPNAVDIEKFAGSDEGGVDLRRRYGLDDKVVFGFVGSFYAYEGLTLLVRALPDLLRADPRIGVLLVGGGPEERAVKDLTSQLGLSKRVVFAGRVPHQSVAAHYDAIDVLVYPRISMRLTELVTPLKPLEAMAQRKLILASNVGGHRELLRDRETAVLFKAGDSIDLVERALELLKNRECWAPMRAAARRFVESERTWPVSVAGYEGVYAQLLDKRVA